jgi:uncharacterized protein (TIGR02271 family)
MTQTKTAMYDTRGAAETARDGLISLGIAETDISIRGTDDAGGTSLTSGSEDKGFWASLADMFVPDDDRPTYEEGVRRGGYLLSARVPDEMATQAEDVMERADPVDIDARSESWRQEGWTSQGTTASGGTYAAAGLSGTGSYASDAGTTTTGTSSYTGTDRTGMTAATGYAGTDRTASGMTGTTAGLGTGDTDETLQVVEEDLRVGKREVAGGRVRVRTYVTERPVEEDVNLRSERVTIERRPVDREVAPGAAAFQERTIEAVERGEEAVVSKTAHVKEEIAIHKDVENRTETVRDTVRSTEVEVDDDRTGHGLAGTDPALRRDRDVI